MPTLLTIKDMQAIAQSRGGRCLSKEYHGQFTRLAWKCKKGHGWDMDYKTVQQGAWCVQCVKDDIKQERLEQLQTIAAQRGGKLLSTVYINRDSHLIWRCKKGHQWKTTSHSVTIGGSWCPVCAGNAKHSLSDMISIARKRGGECLSKKYDNVGTKLQWQCDKGHTWFAKPNSIISGSWCLKCSIVQVHQKQKTPISVYRNIAQKRGGKLLSAKYGNKTKLLRWQCRNNHIWLAAPQNIKNGHWCPYCAGKAKHTIAQMKKSAALHGGKCLSSKYTNLYTKLRWQCSRGHTWLATPTNVIHNGSWCMKCFDKIRHKNLGAYCKPQRFNTSAH